MEIVFEILESLFLLLEIVKSVYKLFNPIEDKKEPGHGQNVK